MSTTATDLADEAASDQVKLRPVVSSYVDITDRFTAEAAKIMPGQLVMMESFELVNSINALEIMDPKMDTGVLNLRSNDANFDVSAPRSPQEILYIMDELFALEMSWCTGCALSQTIYTCLYIEHLLNNFNGVQESLHFGTRASDPPSIDQNDLDQFLLHHALRSYAIGVIKTCDLMRRQLQCKGIFEEEDAVTETYGLDLLQFVSPGYILAVIEAAAFQIECKTSSSDTTQQVLTGIAQRLNLRATTLRTMMLAEAPPAMLQQLYSACIQMADTLSETHELAVAVPTAFSMAVQGRLECGMPPRPLLEMPFAKAVELYQQLQTGMSDLLRIHEYGSIGDIVSYFEHFALRLPDELPYVRSQLHQQYLKDGRLLGKTTMREAVISDITDLCSPMPSLFEIPSSHPAYAALEDFYVQAERCFESYLTVMSHNKCRLRQRLCGLILDWNALQAVAETIESSPEMVQFSLVLQGNPDDPSGGLHPLPLSSWAYYRKLKMMVWIVFLGFELDIYKLDEWPLMLWYVDYLLGITDTHFKRLETVVESMTALHQQQQQQQNTAAKKNRKKKQPQQSAQKLDYINIEAVPRTTMLLTRLRAETEIFREICRGYLCLVAVLTLAGIVNPPRGAQTSPSSSALRTSPELLYRIRLKPFGPIVAPEVPPYETYLQLSDLNNWTIPALLDNAQMSLNGAQKMVSQLNKLTRPEHLVNAKLVGESMTKTRLLLLRSCIGMNVSIMRLRQMKLVQSDGGEREVKRKVKVTIEQENYHPFFPVLVFAENEQ
ncbi:Mak10 subunit, NatC N-terminal acetyltransferase-domain-containing protein [Myxozyma melibiosi]|uniref:Mak10 subunit, NatC N-terminal acetyltransferase-domain-containing protein n=1 Tax=Myxozyma melibiosi TaxID=54550 RepID=A0ABR1F0V2_9ASCO